jgi:hypothetical protein
MKAFEPYMLRDDNYQNVEVYSSYFTTGYVLEDAYTWKEMVNSALTKACKRDKLLMDLFGI